ncbi:MAG TPA: hypothetical protein VLJ58_12770 [Ramlibacter sp.]|nr:hypothetical protein [Ramlibacter sp.]
MKASTPLLAGLRRPSAWLAGLDDPHDELLALLWGPRFDREHARALAAAQPRPGDALSHLLAAADQYDSLPSPHQQRLRRLVLRQRARWDNRRHAAHPAD